jgi:hypothetical protein
MDLDRGTVAAALKEGADSVKFVKRYQLGGKYLKGDASLAWRIVERHVSEFNDIPTLQVIQKEVPSFQLPEEEIDKLEYYVSELRYRDRQESWNRLGPDIGNLVVKQKDFEKATHRIKSFLREQEEKELVDRQMVRSLFDMTPLVRQKYLDMKEGKMGVPFPWSRMNNITLGAEPGDNTGFFGRLGMGKTHALLLSCHHAWKYAGSKTLFVSPEMKQISLAQRMFAYDLRLPHGLVRRGKLDEFTETKFFEELDKFASMDGIYIVDDSFRITLDLLEAAIDHVRPDIVYVDGVYMVLAERGLNQKENADAVAVGLKMIAKKKAVPIVYSSQFNRTVQKNDPSTFTAEGVGISDHFGWFADNMFALIQTDDMKADREMVFKAIKAREASGDDEVRVKWDWEHQDFSQCGDEEKGKFQDADYQAYGGQGAPTNDQPGPDDDLPF